MSVSANKPFNPSRLVVCKPIAGPAPTPAPETKPAPAETTRLEEQKQAARSMLSQLGSDARIAAIMLNPVFAPHANAIAWGATGRAISRYETEVPRKDFSVLMAEEQGKARKEISALPGKYGTAIADGARTAGAAIETGAVATGNAIVTGATATGNAIVTGTKAVGQGLFMGGAAIVGGLVMGGKYALKGIGASLSGLGKWLQGAGSAIEGSGQ